MEFLKKHSNKLIVSLGAAALLVGGYYVIKNNQPKIIKQNGEEVSITSNNSVVFVKDDKYHSAMEKLKPMVASELSGDGLSKQTIIQVNQMVIHVFKSDYLRILVEGRKVRRKFIDNAERYAKEFFKYTTDAEKLMENASIEVLRDLGISMEEYERSSERIMANDSNFAMFNLYMFESVKMQMPSAKSEPLKKEQLIDILSYQAANYSTKEFDNLGLSPQQITMLKQTYVSDKASLKFGYEEEDIMKNPELLQDPEVGAAQKKLQEAIFGGQEGSIGF